MNSAIYNAAQPTGHGVAGINTAFNATNSSMNAIWTLFPVVAIVVVAGVILAIVMGFGRQQA